MVEGLSDEERTVRPKGQIIAILAASGLALGGAASEVEPGADDPGVTDPVAPPDDPGLGGTDDGTTP